MEEQSVTEYAPDPAQAALQAQEGCFCNEILRWPPIILSGATDNKTFRASPESVLAPWCLGLDHAMS